MENIDFNFIKQKEGFILKANVPDPIGSKSGVTIASGFDLGARNSNDLKGLPQNIIDKLKPYLGLKKQAAVKKLKKNPLTITKDEGNIINKFAKDKVYPLLAQRWKVKTGVDFSTLPKHKATVVASVAFQYGNLEEETPNFWKQTTSDDWEAAVNNLLDFGDKYITRRQDEAVYLKKGLDKERLDYNQFLAMAAKGKTEIDPRIGGQPGDAF